MTYFKIHGHDYSMYVSKLVVAKEHIYNSSTNAAKNTIVRHINSKRIIEVGIIPVDADVMVTLQQDINNFAYSGRTHNIPISFIDPETNTLVENLPCFISNQSVEYYTIQDSKVKFKAFSLKFTEL